MITLATLPEATEQEVFNQVAEHLLIQGKRSVLTEEPGEACAYRNHLNLKCAAGCLIGDDEYDPKMENETWGTLCERGTVPSNHRMLICEIQKIHDTFDVVHWRGQLEQLACSHKLDTRVVHAKNPNYNI